MHLLIASSLFVVRFTSLPASFRNLLYSRIVVVWTRKEGIRRLPPSALEFCWPSGPAPAARVRVTDATARRGAQQRSGVDAGRQQAHAALCEPGSAAVRRGRR